MHVYISTTEHVLVMCASVGWITSKQHRYHHPNQNVD